MVRVNVQRDKKWLQKVLSGLKGPGFAVVEKVLSKRFLDQVRNAVYTTREKILLEVGEDPLVRAGERGVLRLMMKFDPIFVRFLEIAEVLEIVDSTVSETAILHLQNGIIWPPLEESSAKRLFQANFHRDFPRFLNGYLASVSCFFAIDAFTKQNGATLVVPGSHQKGQIPEVAELESRAVPVECPAGSMIVFDSTLWHAAGPNRSGQDRLAINHQFTRSFFKQQIDYVRALGDAVIEKQKPRTRQLLGWHTRVPTSLDEYYRPESERLYRRGQG